MRSQSTDTRHVREIDAGNAKQLFLQIEGGLVASAFYALVPAWMQERGNDRATIGLVMLAAVLGGLAFQNSGWSAFGSPRPTYSSGRALHRPCLYKHCIGPFAANSSCCPTNGVLIWWLSIDALTRFYRTRT